MRPPLWPVSATTVTPFFPRRGRSAQHVLGIAAGGEGEEDVAAPGHATELAREHVGELVVVGNRGDGRDVVAQAHGAQGVALALVAAHQLGGEVLRFRGAPAVAARPHRAARAQCRDAHRRRLLHGGRHLGHAREQVRALAQHLFHIDCRVLRHSTVISLLSPTMSR
jgi:hypothetical protein